MQFYQSSNNFFSRLLQYTEGDCVDYTLFEGTHILFFPDLLIADNYFKMGLIDRALGHEKQAQSYWKRASFFARKSLRSERTEWGLSLEDELSSLLEPKRD